MTDDCIFCHEEITDYGLGWYRHVAQAPTCHALWSDWMANIKEDRPEG